MQNKLLEALLIVVFRSARAGRQPNLTAFCRRERVSVSQLQGAFDALELQGLLQLGPDGERLTLRGLAIAAALSSRRRARPRPLAACRHLAA
jgi:hypothetical protein